MAIDPYGSAGLDQPHHDGSELYVDRLGDAVELRIRVPEGDAEAVVLRYVRDDEIRTVEASIASRGDGEVWWRAEVPLRTPVVAYRWLLTGGRLQYRWLNSLGVDAHEVPPTADFRLNAEPGGPEWHLSSVVYEIFIDRFAASGERHPMPAWAVHREWDRLPEVRGRNPHREIYGGDLRGIEQRLDYVEELGANVLYLTPFFPSDSNHRYDPSSFERVDELLGGCEAFESLVRAAHERGIKLVGDLSLDHTGAGHHWFTRAQADPESLERSFFLFDRSETHGYASWLGYKELPRFDWRSDELRGRMSDIVRRWLDSGLDGWRIGAATSVGRYRDMDLNAEVARLVRASAGDGLLVAEYWNDFQQDLDGRGWHGVMNYVGFLRPVWWWLQGGAVGESVFDVFSAARAPSYTGSDAAAVMRAFRAGVPWEAVLQSWILLESHDTPRLRNVARSRERQLVGAGLQMTSPGVPMIFAGAEIGLEGDSGYDTRRTMPWAHRERWDEQVLREYRKLIALRRSSDALARGGIRYVHLGDDAIAYVRESRSERVLCLAARAAHEPITVPFASLETLYGGEARDGVLPSDGPAFHAWRVAD